MERNVQTHSVAYAVLRSGSSAKGVLTSGAVTCTRVGNRWFDVETGVEYKLKKINRHPYFVKGDWK